MKRCPPKRDEYHGLSGLLLLLKELLLKEPQVGLPALQGAVNVLTPSTTPQAPPTASTPHYSPSPAHCQLFLCGGHKHAARTILTHFNCWMDREVATLPLGTQDTLGESWPAPHLPARQFYGEVGLQHSLQNPGLGGKRSFGSGQGRERL